MPDQCSNCSYSDTLEGFLRCCFSPPILIGPYYSQFPLVKSDWTCQQHSNKQQPNQPVTVVGTPNINVANTPIDVNLL